MEEKIEKRWWARSEDKVEEIHEKMFESRIYNSDTLHG